jgi:hypothetical protein
MKPDYTIKIESQAESTQQLATTVDTTLACVLP